MVDVLGHFAMALLWTLPAWVLWDSRIAVPSIGLALSTAMLPDVDLALQTVLAVHHHGVIHTALFVTVVALVFGLGIQYGASSSRKRLLWGHQFSGSALFLVLFGGLLVGGYSHLFADMLSAPDAATPIEPFWPFFDKPWSIDVIQYTSFWWNEGLLVVALVLHATAFVLAPSLSSSNRPSNRSS